MDPNAKALYDAMIASMGDLDEFDDLFHGLIYGVDGIGKTVLAMMIAQMITPPDKQIALVASNNNYRVIKNPRWRKVGLDRRTKLVRWEGWSQIKTLSQLIQVDHEGFNFGCIVMDELSQMLGTDIQRLHDQHKLDGKKDTDDDVPGWGEYNPAKNRYLKMMEDLMAANTHIIAVAHRREEMNRAKQLLISPDFIPSVRKEVTKPFSFVGYMTADLVSSGDTGDVSYTRSVQVHPTKLIGAKTKIDNLPLQVLAEDLPVYIKEWIDGERDSSDADNRVFNDPSDVVEDDEGVVLP